MMKNSYLLSIILLTALVACKKNNFEKEHPKKMDTTKVPLPTPTPTPTVDTCKENIKYSVQIKRMMNQSCATVGCHDAASQAKGLDLSKYNSLVSNKSEILERINNGTMPPIEQLSECDKSKVKSWIDAGALNN